MTKLETVHFLVGPQNENIAMQWDDERILNIWNSMYIDSIFRLIKKGDEFHIESCPLLHDFTKDAMRYFLNN